MGWKAPLNRLVLSTNAEWVKTRTRPGFEIDTRAERDEPAYAGSVEVRGLSKTFIGVRGGWSEVLFDNAAAYEGESLKRELDRTERAAAVTVRHDLTPLTSVTFSAGRSEERFTYSPSRDSTSDDYSVTLNFDPGRPAQGQREFRLQGLPATIAGCRPVSRRHLRGQPVVHAPRIDAILHQSPARRRVFVRHRPALLSADRRRRFDYAADLRTGRCRRACHPAAARVPHPCRDHCRGTGSNRPDSELWRRRGRSNGRRAAAWLQHR